MAVIEKIDVLVVGSGPAGTSTALHLLQRDAAWSERVVILDKAVHPREKLCGGGITHLGQNILLRLGLDLEPSSFDVREARLMYEDRSYSFLGNPVFRIVRRDEFDHWLVNIVEEKGVTVRQGEGAEKITVHQDYVEVVTDKRTFQAKVLVGADGSRSFVRRALKWPGASNVARLLEVLTPEKEQAQPEFREAVAVFDFTRTFHGLQGYYWDFPSYIKGKPFMNRGLFDSRARPERARADLKQTLRDSLAERERNLEDYQLKGHPIRWWDRSGVFSMDRVLLVGDAAGADPLMGEGISFALGYGAVAAETIADAFQRQEYSLASYRSRLMADPLFKQLDLRTWLARIAYQVKSPAVFRFAWRLAPWVVRFTRWRDPNFQPVERPGWKVSRQGHLSSSS